MGDVVSLATGLRELDKPLKPGGGDGTSGGMEARVAKLESDVSHIRSDIGEIKADIRDLRGKVDLHLLLLLSAFGAGFLALLGMMAKGFHWL